MPGNSASGRRQVFGWDERHRKAASLAEAGAAGEALIELQRVLRENPDDSAAHSYRLFLQHHRLEDPMALYHDHLEWGARHAKAQEDGRSPDRANRLRIAYISPHFRQSNPLMS